MLTEVQELFILQVISNKLGFAQVWKLNAELISVLTPKQQRENKREIFQLHFQVFSMIENVFF